MDSCATHERTAKTLVATLEISGLLSTCGFNFLSPSVFPLTMLRCEKYLSRLRFKPSQMLYYLGNRNE